MLLLTLRNISLRFGERHIFDDMNLQIHKGEKICLIGRNGEGKTTLLDVVAGSITPDYGTIEKNKNIKIAKLAQEVPNTTTGTLFDIVKSAFNDQENFEDYQIYSIISQVSLDPEMGFSSLSGGLKRRVLLAKSLVKKPDILLLDEPTNHLDIESIEWMEKILSSYKGTVLFVTHDRTFLQNIASRILELDRAQLTSWESDYSTYLKHKETFLISEEQSIKNFDKKLAQEESWIRQGIPARRKRNQGRVRKLQELRKIRHARKTITGNVNIQIQQEELSGKLVIEAKNISFSYSDQPIIQNFSTTILRGDKIGIIGANGTGKTTLLRLLLKDLQPQIGSVWHGTKLQVIHFDQLRNQLDENKNLIDNVSGASDQVTINGVSKHIISYLQDFLFTPEKALTYVSMLSGGEKNRLLLAKLFTQPANVLVLDEPTNDLDIETLELLESLLVDYQGTLLLISHDRAFLNNIVTSTIAFEKDGSLREYVGDYDDWIRQRPLLEPTPKEQKTKKQSSERNYPSEKLSYKEKRQLESLPQLIEELEKKQEKLSAAMSEPDFYQQEKEKIISIQKQVSDNERKLKEAYDLWEQLEGRA